MIFIIGIIAAMIIWTLFLLIMYFLVSLTIYIAQEINHEIRKTKQALKQSWWDLEWRWKLMKRR